MSGRNARENYNNYQDSSSNFAVIPLDRIESFVNTMNTFVGKIDELINVIKESIEAQKMTADTMRDATNVMKTFSGVMKDTVGEINRTNSGLEELLVQLGKKNRENK